MQSFGFSSLILRTYVFCDIHLEQSIGTPDSVVEVYDRGCTCLRCFPSELLTLSLVYVGWCLIEKDMRSYVESVLDEEETVEVLDFSQDELDKVAYACALSVSVAAKSRSVNQWNRRTRERERSVVVPDGFQRRIVM